MSCLICGIDIFEYDSCVCEDCFDEDLLPEKYFIACKDCFCIVEDESPFYHICMNCLQNYDINDYEEIFKSYITS